MRNGFRVPAFILSVSLSATAMALPWTKNPRLCNPSSSALPNDALLFDRKNRALEKIKREGPQTCASLASQRAQEKCNKVLEVAKATINLAYEENLKRFACGSLKRELR